MLSIDPKSSMADLVAYFNSLGPEKKVTRFSSRVTALRRIEELQEKNSKSSKPTDTSGETKRGRGLKPLQLQKKDGVPLQRFRNGSLIQSIFEILSNEPGQTIEEIADRLCSTKKTVRNRLIALNRAVGYGVREDLKGGVWLNK